MAETRLFRHRNITRREKIHHVFEILNTAGLSGLTEPASLSKENLKTTAQVMREMKQEAVVSEVMQMLLTSSSEFSSTETIPADTIEQIVRLTLDTTVTLLRREFTKGPEDDELQSRLKGAEALNG